MLPENPPSDPIEDLIRRLEDLIEVYSTCAIWNVAQQERLRDLYRSRDWLRELHDLEAELPELKRYYWSH